MPYSLEEMGKATDKATKSSTLSDTISSTEILAPIERKLIILDVLMASRPVSIAEFIPIVLNDIFNGNHIQYLTIELIHDIVINELNNDKSYAELSRFGDLGTISLSQAPPTDGYMVDHGIIDMPDKIRGNDGNLSIDDLKDSIDTIEKMLISDIIIMPTTGVKGIYTGVNIDPDSMKRLVERVVLRINPRLLIDAILSHIIAITSIASLKRVSATDIIGDGSDTVFHVLTTSLLLLPEYLLTWIDQKSAK